MIAVSPEGAEVATIDEVEFARFDLVAVQPAEAKARILNLAALPPDVFTLARAQVRQELTKIPVTAVLPVILPVVARQQPRCRQGRIVISRHEVAVPGRKLQFAALFQCHLHEHLSQSFGVAMPAAGQQPPSLHRRKRDAGQQLRIISLPVPLIGIRPGPVEHEFAVRVGLDVRRRERDQTFVLVNGQMVGNPASLSTDAAGYLECRQESVGQEGIAVVFQFLPVACID